MKNYYQILGVNKNATKKEISEAFKRLSLINHPDRNGGEHYYAEIFKEINEANQVLSNEEKRTKYDHSLKKVNSGNPFIFVKEEFLQRKKLPGTKCLYIILSQIKL